MKTSPSLTHEIRLRRGLAFGVIIITALFAFEVFNYSTTDYALSDLLGDLKFMGLRWSTILAIAFCGIDFAGIARLFSPNDREPGTPIPYSENWYLFGAWFLAATMNAMLTWWGVSLAVLGHQTLGNEVVSRDVLLRVVPIFVAILVWLIRVLIIGTFSVAGDRLFGQDAPQVMLAPRQQLQARPVNTPALTTSTTHAPVQRSGTQRPVTAQGNGNNYRSVRTAGNARPAQTARFEQARMEPPEMEAPEPTYHNLNTYMNNGSGRPANGNMNNGVNGHNRPSNNRPNLFRP